MTGLAQKLWKYIFPPVNVKFSVFAVLFGFVAALIYGYEGQWLPWGHEVNALLILLLIVITDFIGEGVWQHGFDILNDKSGGLSGFREAGKRAERIARGMVKFAFIWGLIASIILIYSGRIMAVAIGWVAAFLAWRYSHVRNECYAFISVAIAATAGWFALTNKPGPELIPVMLISGMASRLSLAFYRYDDYKGLNTKADFKDDMELLVYYRNLFWIILWFPWLSAILLLWTVTDSWDWRPIVATLPPLLEMITKRKYWCHTSNH